MLQPWSKKLEILLFFRHAQCSPLAACRFVTERSLGNLRRGRQGKLTESPYFFIPQCWLFLSQMCEIFILSWLGILKIKMYQWLQKDFWQFSKEFWTLLKMSEDVPANFESFQSYLKVTILACFVYGTLSCYSLPSFTAGILFFPGL